MSRAQLRVVWAGIAAAAAMIVYCPVGEKDGSDWYPQGHGFLFTTNRMVDWNRLNGELFLVALVAGGATLGIKREEELRAERRLTDQGV